MKLFRDDQRLRLLFQGGWAARKFVYASRGKLVLGLVEKPNGTYASFVDEQAEQIALPYLRKAGLEVTTEESGIHGASEGDEIILLDPLDGTIDFLAGGSNHVVIAATLNRKTMLVTRSVVIEVVSGMVRFAVTGKGTYSFQFRGKNLEADLASARQDHVWEGKVSQSTRLLVDFAPLFKKGGAYPEVPHERWCRFTAELYAKTGIGNLFSNGMHRGLVSGGGARIVGAVTTALGGPWDVAPVLLELEAGGYAKAFSTAGNSLDEVDPLDVTRYNYLVSGNSRETVEVIAGVLIKAIRPQ